MRSVLPHIGSVPAQRVRRPYAAATDRSFCRACSGCDFCRPRQRKTAGRQLFLTIFLSRPARLIRKQLMHLEVCMPHSSMHAATHPLTTPMCFIADIFPHFRNRLRGSAPLRRLYILSLGGAGGAAAKPQLKSGSNHHPTWHADDRAINPHQG